MCLTTRPVSSEKTCVVPPAAASLGFQGRSKTQEKLHSDCTTSSPLSSRALMFSRTSFINPPRLETFFLKRAVPLKDTKGSAKTQSLSYACGRRKRLSAPLRRGQYTHSQVAAARNEIVLRVVCTQRCESLFPRQTHSRQSSSSLRRLALEKPDSVAKRLSSVPEHLQRRAGRRLSFWGAPVGGARVLCAIRAPSRASRSDGEATSSTPAASELRRPRRCRLKTAHGGEPRQHNGTKQGTRVAMWRAPARGGGGGGARRWRQWRAFCVLTHVPCKSQARRNSVGVKFNNSSFLSFASKASAPKPRPTPTPPPPPPRPEPPPSGRTRRHRRRRQS